MQYQRLTKQPTVNDTVWARVSISEEQRRSEIHFCTVYTLPSDDWESSTIPIARTRIDFENDMASFRVARDYWNVGEKMVVTEDTDSGEDLDFENGDVPCVLLPLSSCYRRIGY